MVTISLSSASAILMPASSMPTAMLARASVTLSNAQIRATAMMIASMIPPSADRVFVDVEIAVDPDVQPVRLDVDVAADAAARLQDVDREAGGLGDAFDFVFGVLKVLTLELVKLSEVHDGWAFDGAEEGMALRRAPSPWRQFA